MIVFISVPGILLWAFGIPYFFLKRLQVFLSDIEGAKTHSDPKVLEALQQRFRLRLGFLTSGYQEEYYYWEVVLLYRKTLIVLMMTFLAPVSGGV